jgi:meiotic recombination protein SPO11
VFGIFDCDRDGIAIMQTYRQGSIALAHEQSSTVPEMRWLGMRLADVVTGALTDEPLLPLTLIDRERIRAMLARQSNDADSVEQQCFLELQKMLVLNVKAETQILDDRPGGLVQWLEERIWRELASAAL